MFLYRKFSSLKANNKGRVKLFRAYNFCSVDMMLFCVCFFLLFFFPLLRGQTMKYTKLIVECKSFQVKQD